MSVSTPVGTDHQLARLLQIGMVLEEVVEARAAKHAQSMEEGMHGEMRALLADAAEESAGHRERLAELVDELDADRVPFDQIEGLVEAQYGQTKPEDFDGVLYDQLCNEETAYKFYDDLIGAIEESDATFSVDRERLLETLVTIREEEAAGVERVTGLMEREGAGTPPRDVEEGSTTGPGTEAAGDRNGDPTGDADEDAATEEDSGTDDHDGTSREERG